MVTRLSSPLLGHTKVQTTGRWCSALFWLFGMLSLVASAWVLPLPPGSPSSSLTTRCRHSRASAAAAAVVGKRWTILSSMREPREEGDNNKDEDDETKETLAKKRGWLRSMFGGNKAEKSAAGEVDVDENKEQQPEDKGTAVATLTAAAAAADTPMGNNNNNNKENSSGSNNNNSNDNNNDNNDDPAALARKYRAEAERVRLEAERMDAQLTLEKIAKLEKAIRHSQDVLVLKEQQQQQQSSPTTATTAAAAAEVEKWQKELLALQRKLAPAASASAGTATDSATTPRRTSSSSSSSSTTTSTTTTGNMIASNELSKLIIPLEEENLVQTIKMVNEMPSILLKTMALQVELPVTDINKTELALRLDQMNRLDFSYSPRPQPPTFTLRQVKEREMEIKQELRDHNGDFAKDSVLGSVFTMERVNRTAVDMTNITQLALVSLEFEYYTDNLLDLSSETIEKVVEGEEWLKPVLDTFNKSMLDATIETLYPKCTRKAAVDGRENDKDLDPSLRVPTAAQVQQLVNTVLPKTPFQPLPGTPPERVLGGYIVRGKVIKRQDKDKDNNNRMGDVIVDAIQEQMNKLTPNLVDKMQVLLTNDFTLFSDEETVLQDPNFDPDLTEPILYITAPDICRSPRPLQLTFVSGLGIVTTWYLSLYPFLLNPVIGKRVDQELAAVDPSMGMTPDLAWLTDLSVPLFATFLSVLLAHEMGHLVAAGAHKIKTSVPTFVPSIITGVTSTVTTFRSVPKNKNAMFDFSVAGPLAGMITSLVAIAIGSQLTASAADLSYFPALPLEILRQSTLGGGVINQILGNGALNVPASALGTSAVAGMTIPLHPMALAGYIGLIVNALAVLPIGTTDGGRMGLALFGRATKLVVGNLFLFALLFAGLFGSDLFLFYFSFCIAFQTGNEIPAQNEVDKVDFSRILVAAATYVLALLVLIPFQQ